MKIVVQIRARTLRHWHGALLSRLGERADTVVALDHRPEIATPAGIDALMQLEAVLHGVPRPGLATSMSRETLARFCGDPHGADLILAIDGAAEYASGTSAWQVTFDGCVGEEAMFAALLARQPPLVSIVDARDVAVARGRTGSEAGHVLLRAAEDTLARVQTLVVAALDGAATSTPHESASAGGRPAPALTRTAGKAVAAAAIRRIYRLCYNTPHWRVGWRRAQAADVVRELSTAGAPWTVLPDDGGRYYADPFALTVGDTTTLFVEDFSHRLGKGVISAVAVTPAGPAGTPRPVLETSSHLSYPHVFTHDGAIWMVPESSQARRIDLFRATAFPGGWVREATLVDDIVASDATLVVHAGRWWMFATVQDGGGAFSDALHLWSALQLQGPWRPHPRNPVLIDIASARPAGAMIVRDGALLRPAQDCRAGYGAALGIATVTRLDDEGFAQTMRGVAQDADWRGRLHTYNRCGPFEFIDGSARARKTLLRRDAR